MLHCAGRTHGMDWAHKRQRRTSDRVVGDEGEAGAKRQRVQNGVGCSSSGQERPGNGQRRSVRRLLVLFPSRSRSHTVKVITVHSCSGKRLRSHSITECAAGRSALNFTVHSVKPEWLHRGTVTWLIVIGRGHAPSLAVYTEKPGDPHRRSPYVRRNQ